MMDSSPPTIDSVFTTRATPLLSAAEPPKARRLRLIITVAVVTLGSSMQSGFATGVVRRTTAPTHTLARCLTRASGSLRQLNNLDKIVPDSLAAAGSPVSSTGWSSIVSGFGVGGLLGCAAARRKHGSSNVRGRVLERWWCGTPLQWQSRTASRSQA